MAWHDVLLCFLLKETSVYTMMDAALRTLDTDLRMFTDCAYVGYSVRWIWIFRTLCGFLYVYTFDIHVVGLVRAILFRWRNINVHYDALVAI